MALTDLQIALLRHAAADESGTVEIELPEGSEDARTVIRELVDLGYVEASPRPAPMLDGATRPEGERMLLKVTQAGRDAFGLDPDIAGKADGT